MKAKDIKVGTIYRNAGAGRTQRRVLGIGPEYAPTMAYDSERPDGWTGVEYQQRVVGDAVWREVRRMWIDSFASWAGSEVTE